MSSTPPSDEWVRYSLASALDHPSGNERFLTHTHCTSQAPSRNPNSIASDEDGLTVLEGVLEVVSEVIDTSSLSSVDIPSSFYRETDLQAVHPK